MNTFTFGVKNVNGYHHKLIVCHQTKQYERGQCCINSDFIDVWVNSQKDLNAIQRNLSINGYNETDKKFGRDGE